MNTTNPTRKKHRNFLTKAPVITVAALLLMVILTASTIDKKPEPSKTSAKSPNLVLKPETFRPYIEGFNKNDNEQKVNYIPNQEAWNWLQQNIPFFECSDKDLEEMYYFRWWTFRKHIKQTPDGFVITEFLPDVSWAGKYNTISCAAGHHFYEGRWLRDRQYMKDYAYFWFKKGGEPRRYSFWAADAIRAWALVTQDQQTVFDLLPDLVSNYKGWEKNNQDENGLFWQIDDRDGMEFSIGGSGYRPTINSYMYGEAMALSDISNWVYQPEQSLDFGMKAARLRELVERGLWDETNRFYKTLPRQNQDLNTVIQPFKDQSLARVRELAGYLPWYFNLPMKPGREVVWKQITDPRGFKAPFGLTTAEQRSEKFMFKNEHECLWNGPSWPYATSQTLTAMANLLNNYKQSYVDKKDYLDLLTTYAKSQHLKLPDGKVIPFIDENLDPNTGDWIARKLLYAMPPEKQIEKGGKDRGRDYNHSTFNDLIITGFVGLRPHLDQRLEINPLIPEGSIEYFCLDGLRYHDLNLTILWDKSGERYHKGKGLHVFANGQEIASAPGLQWIMVNLPENAAGWKKCKENPLIGGGNPTPEISGKMADVAVIRENGKYWLYGSWYHKNSIALFESSDGEYWEKTGIALEPDTASGWENNVSRPTIVKKDGLYHMWYTGQNEKQYCIGYATSKDGKTWKRMGEKPVMVPDLPWEKESIMCPHVLWDDSQKVYRMWYSGGSRWEPDAIGYATSKDGLYWDKYNEPVFTPKKENVWEQDRATAAQVFYDDGWYYMAYIGFRDPLHAQIGMARSRDGITNWERHPNNPLVRPGQDGFDQDCCYKPFMLFDGKQWLLWYNGCHHDMEWIGVVKHQGKDLGF